MKNLTWMCKNAKKKKYTILKFICRLTFQQFQNHSPKSISVSLSLWSHSSHAENTANANGYNQTTKILHPTTSCHGLHCYCRSSLNMGWFVELVGLTRLLVCLNCAVTHRKTSASVEWLSWLIFSPSEVVHRWVQWWKFLSIYLLWPWYDL